MVKKTGDKCLNSKNAWKKMISDYIMVQAEIAFSIAIIGSIFAKDQRISYSYFFLPAFLGFICMLPCVVTYFKENMTIRQIMIQRVLELIVLEIAIIGILHYILGDTLGAGGYVAIAVSILVFEVLTYVLSYVLEQKEADAINEKLKADRENLCVNEGGSINEKGV